MFALNKFKEAIMLFINELPRIANYFRNSFNSDLII